MFLGCVDCSGYDVHAPEPGVADSVSAVRCTDTRPTPQMDQQSIMARLGGCTSFSLDSVRCQSPRPMSFASRLCSSSTGVTGRGTVSRRLHAQSASALPSAVTLSLWLVNCTHLYLQQQLRPNHKVRSLDVDPDHSLGWRASIRWLAGRG
ncbi:hypothetical protein BDU57DRAFT_327819 [Ampelomyces quisqualis]|uniref:Uncharacterized protein n=1 Tax=Ampelomyces quisqualis TaxID=50730 RepID=A0A6A5QHG3_AMPQU|nr:hypothetical protein BDU57DRAFT_327819 [Ampelomyces quisqualis]